MFKVMKELFTSGNKDLRHRIYFTLGALMIFVLGISIRVPGTEDLTKNLGFLELINTIGGGALKNFSIFALGVMPYITASIIIQLLQMDIIPYFTELRKQGHTGRQKINQITRYLGIAFAFIEGYAFAFAFLGKTGDPLRYMYIATVLTAGTSLLLWMGDQISQKGIGNGQSLIIMAGIIATLPQMFIDAFSGLVVFEGTAQVITLGIIKFILFILIYFAIVIGIIFVQESERRIPIQYSNRTTSAYGAQQSFLPIKINSAGVMPVIFASVLTTIPATIVQITKNEAAINFVNNYIVYTSPTGFLLYIILIFVFGYFYTFLSMNPEEMSKNLNKNGGYIPGVRPGEDTSNYISKSLSRLTMVGSLFLVILAGLPVVISTFTDLPSNVTIGGTGILIVVGVAIETYKQIESSLTARSYSARKKRFR